MTPFNSLFAAHECVLIEKEEGGWFYPGEAQRKEVRPKYSNNPKFGRFHGYVLPLISLDRSNSLPEHEVKKKKLGIIYFSFVAILDSAVLCASIGKRGRADLCLEYSFKKSVRSPAERGI